MPQDASAFLKELVGKWTTEGLAGPTEKELLLPEGMEQGSAAHLRFLTLPRVISGLYDEVELWERAGALWANPDTRWLFDPSKVAYADWREVEEGLKTQRLAERRQDMRAWYDVARGLQGRFKGDVAALIAASDNDAKKVIAYMENSPATFPFLSGEQTVRLWLDQLHRVGSVPLDQHETLRVSLSKEARATLTGLGLGIDEEQVHPSRFLALEVLAALPAKKREAVEQDVLARSDSSK